MANDSKAVRNLIAVLRDGEKGFADIGEHIKNPEYRTYFLEESRVRGSYAAELESAVDFVTDAEVHETGTVAGTLHRVWGDIKGHLGGNDHTLLETAESGEDAAKKAYKEALEDTGVSDTIRTVIQQQYAHVQASHDRVKAWRDTGVAAV